MSDLKNGKTFVGQRFGSLVVVKFCGMIEGDAHKRKSVWRANCDCDPNGESKSRFVYDTIRNIKLNGCCGECKKLTDKRRRQS